ncbi:ATP-binding protein [Sulfuricystis multivorans]|uniref:ATP-binding protein n=1 Tax=Sulfuricystis multivorans TaxID=2211108 RepID=UPI000F818328|nr:ATP-binding protein [Sulfuricystis multivorans]
MKYRFDDLSLRWKIPLRVMLAVVGTALAVTAALVARQYDEMRQNLESHGKSLARVLANTLVVPVLHDDIWRAWEIIQSARDPAAIAPELQAKIVLVTDNEFRVFVSNQPRLFPIGSSPAAQGSAYGRLRAAMLEGNPADQKIIEPADAPYYYVMSPLVADGVNLGHVILGYSKISFLPRFIGLVGQAIFVTMLALALIMPISWIWARRTGEPLVALAEAMRQVPDQLEAARLAELPKSRDEIGQLGDAFRRMVGELKKKQELENQMLVSERLAAVGRMSAGIAHEINNPLGGMLTAIKTWQKHGSHDPMATQMLSLLERGLTQIRNTVSALLVETKMQDRSFEPADIDDLLILVEGEAQARSVKIEAEIDIGAVLPLPATLVRQILLNLLLNAIAAAAEGGKVQLGAHAHRGRLLLTVGNDGEYIPEERMAYLFEPFTSGRSSGHGLGLWVVYQIVRQLNGGLSVESHPGHTVFSVEIPYEMPA